MTIDLALNETQVLLQNTVRAFCERSVTLAQVRDWETTEAGFSRPTWEEMARLGWLGITLPEAYGGSGGSFLDLYPMCVELGRALAPGPFLESAVVAAETILRAGSEEQRRELLPRMARGEMIVVPALLEASATFEPSGIETSASTAGSNAILDGTKLLVPYASSADSFLVPARLDGATGPDELAIFLVPADTAGVLIETLPNIAGVPLAAVSFAACTVAADSQLGTGPEGWRALDEAVLKAGVLQAAMLVGAGERVLEMTANYARDRVQFGTPIGHHQAVQYMVSDILMDLERTRHFTLNAAWCIDQGRAFEREAARAKAFASRAAAHMMRQAHEVHAGVAFMMEHDLQLFSRRAKHWESAFGDARYHEERMLAAAGV
jgi:alkylation response protein AidB-like acyl-CoA dehydrogenase